ncbi:MAG: UDP-4-amino-4-deoxy-L-arabinose aminotransferase [Lentisphaeria bacterium]|nr:UDP-4-amino-4-deoxy-L-arabinose aminotransferase [Lentisphaeria bacterium]
MRKEFLPFTAPAVNENDIAAVSAVLRSGWITNGPVNAEFEQEMCKYTGNTHAVALASATAGMHLLMKVLDIKPGDEIITPSMTWVSIANMIVLAGAKPVFVDVDRDTLLVQPEAVKAAITERTKLIVPVHFAGAALDLDAIKAVAGDIPVLEDAAHAVGTFYKGRHIGQNGMALYSFHAIKNITCGEGGMFITDNAELADQMRRWKFHGIGMDAFDRQNRGRSPQAEVLAPGFKYNLTDMQAALGLSQLRRVDEINAKRRELAALYDEYFQEIPEVLPLVKPQGYDSVHAHHLYVVRVNTPKIDRNTFMAELKKRNIGTGIHFRCAHLQKFYREYFNFAPGMLPATEFNSDRICSLPLFPGMDADDVKDVIEAIKDVLA